jgi:hypothetical protein
MMLGLWIILVIGIGAVVVIAALIAAVVLLTTRPPNDRPRE